MSLGANRNTLRPSRATRFSSPAWRRTQPPFLRPDQHLPPGPAGRKGRPGKSGQPLTYLLMRPVRHIKGAARALGSGLLGRAVGGTLARYRSPCAAATTGGIKRHCSHGIGRSAASQAPQSADGRPQGASCGSEGSYGVGPCGGSPFGGPRQPVLWNDWNAAPPRKSAVAVRVARGTGHARRTIVGGKPFPPVTRRRGL